MISKIGIQSLFLLLASTCLISTNRVEAQVTFSFNYTDAAGVGFNDTAAGADRKAALELAAQQFANAFSSYTANIVLNVDGSAGGSTLMAAGSEFDATRTVGFGNDEVVRNKVLNGTDLNGSAADGSVVVNFSTVNWELDFNTTPSGGNFDWYSTAYHEFAHAFGFSSAINTDGTAGGTDDGYGGYDPTMDGSWGAFDQFLTDAAGNSVFSGANLDETNYAALVKGGASPANGLFFNSTAGGALYGLYTPTSFEGGSSGSHLDDENAAFSGLMMLAATGPGPSARTLDVIEQNIFRDIGYANIGQIGSIPEPGSAIALGLLVVGMTIRRSRRSN